MHVYDKWRLTQGQRMRKRIVGVGVVVERRSIHSPRLIYPKKEQKKKKERTTAAGAAAAGAAAK